MVAVRLIDLRNQEMEIFLASPRGFCAGVRRAVESLRTALDRVTTPLYVYNEIVHNRHVVAEFSDRVQFVRKVESVPIGATLLISAHGVAPKVHRQATARNLRVLDATCPLVTRLHELARRFAADGYHILLIGHQGHDEVIGVQGEAPGSIHVVLRPEDVNAVTVANPDRVAWLTQTTLSVQQVEQIVPILKERFPKIVGPFDGTTHERTGNLCYATQNRQEVIRQFAPQCDRVVVVGSPNSSNSCRLAETAEIAILEADGKANKRPLTASQLQSLAEARSHSKLVDDAGELDRNWFLDKDLRPINRVLLTAGASAPERLVQECIVWFTTQFDAQLTPATLLEETTRFPLPESLTSLDRSDLPKNELLL